MVLPPVPEGGARLPGDIARRLVPERWDARPRAGRGRGPPLLAVRGESREARPRPVVPQGHELRRRAARLQRDRLARADQDAADELDRSERGRGDRLHDGARRPSARRRRAAGLHDPTGHALRCHVHGPGPGASSRRDADVTGPTRRGRCVCRQDADRDGDRAPVDRPGEDGRVDRCRRDQPGQRRADPDLDRRLRPGHLRDGRDHGGSGPRRARLRLRRALRPADPASRCRPGHRRRRRVVRRLPRSRRRRNPRQLGPIRWPAGGRGRQGDRRGPGRTRAGQADGHVPPPRLAGQPPAVLGRTDPGHLLRTGRDRAGARGGAAGSPARHRRLSRQRREPPRPGRGLRQRHVPALRWGGPPRDRYDGHLRRFVLVLVSLPVTREGRRGVRSGARRTVDAGGPVHGRVGARGHAPVVRPRVHEDDAGRRRAGPGRTLQATLQPGADPRPRRRADVEVARQHRGSGRSRGAVWGRHRQAVPDVHGAVGPGRAVEPDRDRRRPSLPQSTLDHRPRRARKGSRQSRERLSTGRRDRSRGADGDPPGRPPDAARRHGGLRGVPLQHDDREADGAGEPADALPRHERRRHAGVGRGRRASRS